MNEPVLGLSEGVPTVLWRRLAVILYDGFLLAALILVAFLPVPLIPQELRSALWVRVALDVYLGAVAFLFFGWFWTHGGQTLGMRAWRVYLVTNGGGEAVSWRRALLRFGAALVSWGACGGGFLWSLVDKRRRGWHDIWSGTVLVTRPRPAQSGKRLSA